MSESGERKLSEQEAVREEVRSRLSRQKRRWPESWSTRFNQDPDFEKLIVNVGRLKFNTVVTSKWMDMVARVLLAVPPQDSPRAKRILQWITEKSLTSVISDTLNLKISEGSVEFALEQVLNTGDLENWRKLVPTDLHWTFPSSFLDFTEAKAIRDQYANAIFENYDDLRRFMQTSETAIQSRWEAANSNHRAEILRKAWPGINDQHLPNVRDFLTGNVPREEACLWPHLNVQDLSKGDHLIGFLQARTRRPPWMFFWLDRGSWTLAQVRGYLSVPWLGEYVMEITGKETVANYGNIILEEKIPPNKMSIWSQWVVLVDEGLKTMEVQAVTYAFLLQCCLLIMGTTPQEFQTLYHHLDPSGPLQEPPLSLTSDSTLDFFTKFPYRVPGFNQLDMETLLQNVAAYRDLAQDFYLSLRHDPGRFVQALNDLDEHHWEHIQRKEFIQSSRRKAKKNEPADNVKGKHVRVRDPQQLPNYWNDLLMELVKDVTWKVLMWNDLHERLAKIYNWLKPSNTTTIHPDKELPDWINESLEHFIFRLHEIILQSTKTLGRLLAASPPLRDQFWTYPKPNRSANSTNYELERRRALSTADNVSEVQWIIDALAFPRSTFPCSSLIDLLQRAMDSNSAERNQLTVHIQAMIYEVGLLSECQTVMSHLHPWAITAQINMMIQKSPSRNWEEFRGVNSAIERKLSSTARRNFWHGLARSFCGKAPGTVYPEVEKRNGKVISTKRQTAEKALADFWKVVDQKLKFLRVDHPILQYTDERVKETIMPGESSGGKGKKPIKEKILKGKERAEPGMEEVEQEQAQRMEMMQEEMMQEEMMQEEMMQEEMMQEEMMQEEMMQEEMMQEAMKQDETKQEEEMLEQMMLDQAIRESRREAASVSEGLQMSGSGSGSGSGQGAKRAREPEDERENKTVKIDEKKKIKIKTRGTADPSRAAAITPTPAQPAPEPQQPKIEFLVSRKDMKVWRTVFSDKLEGGGQPKKLNWDDFLTAMGNIGFRGRHGSGTGWNFTPPAVLRAGGIVLHAPHGPNHGLNLARDIGARLAKHCHLDISMFKLKD